MDTPVPALSVILPTYNERDNITGLIRAILASAGCTCEVIVVDDDSPDETWKAVEELSSELDSVSVIRRIGRRGLTSAIQEGIDAATGGSVLWMDCDFSMPPEVIPRLLEALAGCDIATGSRYVGGAKDDRGLPMNVFGSRVINFFCRMLLGRGITDYTTGFVSAKRKVFDNIRLRGGYGEYCIDLLYRARKAGYLIKEVPYECVPRQHGESKTASGVLSYLARGVNYAIAAIRVRLGL